MKLILLTTALLAAIPVAFGLTIDSPANVVACEPTMLSWSGGTAPYFLTLVPAGQTTAPALENLGTQQGTSFSWNVDLAPGVSFTIALKDSTGATAYSSIITVNGGGPSCNTTATGSGSSGGSSASGRSSASSGAASTPGSSASTGATATSGGSTSGSTTAAASSSSSTQRSSAGRITTSSALGVAGVMGLVGAMLF